MTADGTLLHLRPLGGLTQFFTPVVAIHTPSVLCSGCAGRTHQRASGHGAQATLPEHEARGVGVTKHEVVLQAAVNLPACRQPPGGGGSGPDKCAVVRTHMLPLAAAALLSGRVRRGACVCCEKCFLQVQQCVREKGAAPGQALIPCSPATGLIRPPSHKSTGRGHGRPSGGGCREGKGSHRHAKNRHGGLRTYT